MQIQIGKLENYEGFKEPETIKVNEVLDICVYIPTSESKDFMIGLIRKDNFDTISPYFLHGKTLYKIFNILKEKGLY